MQAAQESEDRLVHRIAILEQSGSVRLYRCLENLVAPIIVNPSGVFQIGQKGLDQSQGREACWSTIPVVFHCVPTPGAGGGCRLLRLNKAYLGSAFNQCERQAAKSILHRSDAEGRRWKVD
jgi:hypothetical protein